MDYIARYCNATIRLERCISRRDVYTVYSHYFRLITCESAKWSTQTPSARFIDAEHAGTPAGQNEARGYLSEVEHSLGR